jgi:SAM-dependent methyltransferase
MISRSFSWLRSKGNAAKQLLRVRTPGAPPRAPDWLEEEVGRRLLQLDGGLGLFRWVHLVHALGQDSAIRSGLSIGCGEGLHETLLARMFPETAVCGVDLRKPNVEVSLSNLRFLQGDLLDADFAATLPGADFVFSIECLEHIVDDRAVFAKMAQLVRPGGWLYIEVPFASEADQADPQVCRRELEAHEHVRPGYSARQLEDLAREHGLIDIRVAGAFWFPVQPMVWLAMQHIPAPAVADHWRTFLAIAELDLRQAVPQHRGEATGIKLLARRPR